jgi:hypothetical protein
VEGIGEDNFEGPSTSNNTSQPGGNIPYFGPYQYTTTLTGLIISVMPYTGLSNLSTNIDGSAFNNNTRYDIANNIKKIDFFNQLRLNFKNASIEMKLTILERVNNKILNTP